MTPDEHSAAAVETLSSALPPDLEQLVAEVLECADAAGAMLATVESCTGGLLASLLTDVEGKGHIFDCGFATYSTDSKIALLGIDPALLEQRGAVDRDVAVAMAEAALARSSARIAVSTTGFAGRGAPGDEPGLVFIALAERDRDTRVTEHHFGDIGRGAVRIAAVRSALRVMKAALGAARPT